MGKGELDIQKAEYEFHIRLLFLIEKVLFMPSKRLQRFRYLLL